MFLKYLKITFREIKRHKFLTTINVFGLALGLCASILLFTYIEHETSYDKFNQKADRIYQLISNVGEGEGFWQTDICRRVAKSRIEANVPEVEFVNQFFHNGRDDFYVDNQRFSNVRLLYSDKNIFDIFTIKPISGNLSSALVNVKSIVLNEKTALKFFGSSDVVGNTVLYNNKAYNVTAVVKDLPNTSHFSFDVIIPIEDISILKYMHGLEFSTYILFKEGTDHEKLKKLCVSEYGNVLNEHFSKFGKKTSAGIRNLHDIYLNSEIEVRGGRKGDIGLVYIFVAIVLFILAIAIINYVNLFTAHYFKQLKEYSLFKVLGASRKSIMMKMLLTSGLLTLISAFLALIIAELFFPQFNELMNRKLDFSLWSKSGVFFALAVVITSVLSGIYPALMVSGQPVNTVIRGAHMKIGKTRITNLLVIFQFVVSIVTIISVITIVKQTNYLKGFDLGYSPETAIEIGNINRKITSSFEAIKTELLKNPEIVEVGASGHSPFRGTSGQYLRMASQDDSQGISLSQKRIRNGFFSSLGVKIIEGRDFKQGGVGDENSIILNEAAVKALGQTDIIGKRVNMHRDMTVIGVVKDFNYSSLHSGITPLGFTYLNSMYYMIVKTSGKPGNSIMPYIEKTIKDFDKDYVANISIIGDLCKKQYAKEDRTKMMVLYAGIFSIILTLLGLFALSLFIIKNRSKEIGIRKVNGATVNQIIILMNKTYVKLILLGFIIAFPVAWYLMDLWLQGFAYRTNISWWIFLVSGVSVVAVAISTVWYHTHKAAQQNPVKVLRYE